MKVFGWCYEEKSQSEGMKMKPKKVVVIMKIIDCIIMDGYYKPKHIPPPHENENTKKNYSIEINSLYGSSVIFLGTKEGRKVVGIG